MEFNNKQFDKQFAKNNRTSLYGLILIILALFIFIYGIIKYNIARSNPSSLNRVIVEEKGSDQIAYLDVLYMDYIATETDVLHYYFVSDEDNLSYLLGIYEKDFEWYSDEFSRYSTDEAIRVVGYTRPISNELKEFAIDAINDLYDEKWLTSENFENYVGNVYLEAAKKNNITLLEGFYKISSLPIMGSIITFIVGLFLRIFGKKGNKSYKEAAMNTWETKDDFWDEINDPSTIWLENVKTYLTDKHIIFMDSHLSILDYEDIEIVYPTEHYVNHSPDNITLTIGTNMNTKYDICRGSMRRKKIDATKESHRKIIEKIIEKKPSCLVGYNQANLDAYKAICDAYKNQKSDQTISKENNEEIDKGE